MAKGKMVYADVWGDRVKVKSMLIAMLIGVVICLSMFMLGKHILAATSIDESMANSYSLLFGVAGSLISAVISGILFKPQRELNEEEIEIDDKAAIIKELNLDMKAEAEALAHTDKRTIQEMKELGLYDVFARGTDAAQGDDAEAQTASAADTQDPRLTQDADSKPGTVNEQTSDTEQGVK
jgi:hypothetical protein